MPLIRLQNIRKSFQMGEITLEVLRGIDLEIEEGEFAVIMGPSGSGKSTLMNILGFLDVPTSGDYYYKNEKLTAFDEDSLASIRNSEVGFIFQQFQLLNRISTKENVKLPLIYAHVSNQEQEERAVKALTEVGMAHRAHHRPNEISGGEQQRVAIARALVNNPKIIFADEPTGNLDSKTGEEIMEIFNKIHAEGKTIIMVTHDNNIAKHAHRIIRIKDGLIVKNEKKKKTKDGK